MHLFISPHPWSTYYVPAIELLAVSQTDAAPALVGLRGSQQLTFIKLLLYYTRHCAKTFTSLTYVIIIKCFLAILISI